MAMKVGQAAGRHFLRGDHKHRVVIGKDTRLSGYMMETALVAGFTSVGMDVIMIGPMPTPAVALLTRAMRADLGVMISASHNPFADNGIKLFGPDGFKLSDEDEVAIEAAMDERAAARRRRRRSAAPGGSRSARPLHPRDQAVAARRRAARRAQDRGRLRQRRRLQRRADGDLGAGRRGRSRSASSPTALNINDGVGSTTLEAIRRRWSRSRRDIGIALDGDADRLIVIDEKGQAVDGDQIMALIGTRMAAAASCSGGGVVATVMSNLGLERFLAARGSTWCAPRSATATCSRRCARAATTSAASSRGT